MIKKIKIDYNLDVFINADYTVHSGSCISHQVHELTDIHERFGGFPETYDMGNTLIRQLWWTNEQVDYDDLGNQLGMEVITVSSIYYSRQVMLFQCIEILSFKLTNGFLMMLG